MTEDQQAHLQRLNLVFTLENHKKYEAGTSEHPGNIWDLDVLALLYSVREEAIDQFNYVQTLIDKIEDSKLPDGHGGGLGW